MTKTLNLRLVLAIVISLLAFGLTGGATVMVGGAGIDEVERGIGRSLHLLADQMQDKLDRSLFERLRDLGDTARLFSTFNLAERPAAMGTWLDELRGTGDDYGWIGFASTDGRILHGTGRLHESEDVSGRPWFRRALEAPAGGEMRDVTLEEQQVKSDGTGAGAVLSIAQPVLDKSGAVSGVLVAEINWAWADEIRASIIGAPQSRRGRDILLLSPSGTVLLGPDMLLGRQLRLANKSTPAAQQGIFNGRRYLYAYAKTDGYRNFSGIGWSVVVRQDAQVAMQPVRGLQHQMVIWGLGLSVLAAIAAWTVAGLIAAPLLKLARAAQSIQSGANIEMPEVDSYREAKVLSRSFASLVSDLKQREKALARMNETLESQVALRTNELAARNEALVVAHAEAEKATQAKSRFLTAASHDLRQPLHAMTLFARALSRRVDGAEAERLVSQIEDSLRSLKGMFDALLNVSKLDAGLIQPNLSTISVKALMERVSGGFRVDAESRGLRFVSRSVEASLRTDPALLETMLRNLVSNALKFTRAGGVALVARRQAGTIAFQVLDTGPGIGKERQQRIFDEFERAREQAGGLNEGLGLGLSIVRRYARILGIEVKLSSVPGRGTCFSLVVPANAVVDAALSGDGAPNPHAIPALPPEMRILVMDDDPMIVAALTRDLADRGCNTRGAVSPEEAEKILSRGFGADALIVDFDLGCEETGLAFLGRMERKFRRRIPGLILTGGTDATTLAAVANSGARWLTKPADPDVLASALAGMMMRRNMMGEGRQGETGASHESAHSG
jgi:signal transduction histidine kinase/ActR/RegA family two-component response regulator